MSSFNIIKSYSSWTSQFSQHWWFEQNERTREASWLLLVRHHRPWDDLVTLEPRDTPLVCLQPQSLLCCSQAERAANLSMLYFSNLEVYTVYWLQSWTLETLNFLLWQLNTRLTRATFRIMQLWRTVSFYYLPFKTELLKNIWWHGESVTSGQLYVYGTLKKNTQIEFASSEVSRVHCLKQIFVSTN